MLAPMAAVAQEHGQVEGKEHKATETKAQEVKADKEKDWPKCPVMGEPVDFSVRIVTDDGPVYFCCPMCIEDYQKEPAKFSKELEAQREMLAKREGVQISCPLSGKPIDKKVSFEKDSKTVYFCCDKCRTRYAKDPAKYAAKLAAAYWYQTRCPVSGKKINGEFFTDLPTGQRLYFCCAKCPQKFLDDPERYAPGLEEQGVYINPKKIKGKKADAHAGHEEEKKDKP